MGKAITDARLLDVDPLTGIVEHFYYDPDTDGFTIERTQDVSGLLDVNKALWNDAPLRFGEFSHVASIPAVIMEQLAKDGIVTAGGRILDEPRFRKWLNDRDNRLFRTRPGHV